MNSGAGGWKRQPPDGRASGGYVNTWRRQPHNAAGDRIANTEDNPLLDHDEEWMRLELPTEATFSPSRRTHRLSERLRQVLRDEPPF